VRAIASLKTHEVAWPVFLASPSQRFAARWVSIRDQPAWLSESCRKQNSPSLSQRATRLNIEAAVVDFNDQEDEEMNGSGILMGGIGMARKGFRVIIVATTIAVGPVSGALAQAGGPGVAQSIVPGGRSPDAIDRASSLAQRPLNTLPMPAQPTEQYIPDRRVYVPQVGQQIDVPGHFAQRTPDGRVVEPPMTIPTPNGGPPVFVPGSAGVPPLP
jgi:hypothetical protein